MASDFPAQCLLIENLQNLEQMLSMLEEVDTSVCAAIDKLIKHWIEEREPEWVGNFDFLNSDTSFRRQGWPVMANQKYAAYFTLRPEAMDEYVHAAWISAYLGVVKTRAGFWFEVEAKTITGSRGKGARPQKDWENFLAGQYEALGLRADGFVLSEGGCLFLPVKLDVKLLAESYPGTLPDALEPFRTALDVIERTAPKFDQLLLAAARTFDSVAE